MLQTIKEHPIAYKLIALFALLFGLMTIRAGGLVLFTDGAAHQAAGDYVPFVLWFNFIAGFLYLVAAAGIWMQRRWAGWVALLIAVSTLIIFAALAVHILAGGAYETRTIVAMTLRSTVWVAITWATFPIGRPDAATCQPS